MTSAEILHLLPYLGSLALSLGVAGLAWQRRQSKDVFACALYVTGQTLWILGFIIELLAPTLDAKIFWDGFQWLASFFVIIAFPAFAVQYTEQKLDNPKRLFLYSLITPVLFTVVLLTGSLRHLIYSNPHLLPASPFPELTYDFTWFVYGFALYSYATVFWGVRFLLKRLFQPHNLYRTQLAIIIIGFLIPIIGTIFSLAGIQITPQRDAFPFTSALANLIIAWGLFRQKLFEVVPVGRDRLFEAMVDPVVILNNQHKIVDVNSAMLALLDKHPEEVRGHPAKQVFEYFPIPIKLYTHVSYARTEATFEIGGKDVYYEMTV